MKWLKVTTSTPEEDMISDQCGLPGVPHGARLRSVSGGGLHPCGHPHPTPRVRPPLTGPITEGLFKKKSNWLYVVVRINNNQLMFLGKIHMNVKC